MRGESLAIFADRLRAQGVIAPDAPPPPDEPHDRPWFIALLQGLAGWLAGVLLVIFVAVVLEPESRAAFLLLGSLLVVSAWAIYHSDPDAVFLDQLALALSIAGQIALVVGLAREDPSGLTIALTSLAVQVAVFIAMPNRAARTLAAAFAGIAWMYTVRFLSRSGSGEALFFGDSRELAWPASPWLLPLAWLLTWAPLIGLAVWLIRRESRWMSRAWRTHARPLLTGLLVCAALGGALTEPFVFRAFGPQTWGLHFSWHALFPLLSLALSLLAAYGAFRVRSAGLLGLAICGGLLHLARFSYFYGSTLLMKSMILLCLGASMLAAGLWLQRRLAAPEDA